MFRVLGTSVQSNLALDIHEGRCSMKKIGILSLVSATALLLPVLAVTSVTLAQTQDRDQLKTQQQLQEKDKLQTKDQKKEKEQLKEQERTQERTREQTRTERPERPQQEKAERSERHGK